MIARKMNFEIISLIFFSDNEGLTDEDPGRHGHFAGSPLPNSDRVFGKPTSIDIKYFAK